MARLGRVPAADRGQRGPLLACGRRARVDPETSAATEERRGFVRKSIQTLIDARALRIRQRIKWIRPNFRTKLDLILVRGDPNGTLIGHTEEHCMACGDVETCRLARITPMEPIGRLL